MSVGLSDHLVDLDDSDHGHFIQPVHFIDVLYRVQLAADLLQKLSLLLDVFPPLSLEE